MYPANKREPATCVLPHLLEGGIKGRVGIPSHESQEFYPAKYEGGQKGKETRNCARFDLDN